MHELLKQSLTRTSDFVFASLAIQVYKAQTTFPRRSELLVCG